MIITDDCEGASVSVPQGKQMPTPSDLPPAFEESVGHIVLEESPPEFTPYEADFFTAKNGCIISHDPHLNEDGEALYRFILSQTSVPPTYLLHCRGTHDETRTRVTSYTNKHGREKRRSETYIETVTDFDFMVDVGRTVPASSGVVHWSVSDSEPAYRGSMVREVELGPNEALVFGKHRRKATNSEIKMFKAWEDERREKGLPPWVGRDSRWDGIDNSIPLHGNGGLRSSKTLRTWADEYCASKKLLKEFTYEKVVYGWNIDSLKSAIRATIMSTSYTGDITVSFEYTAHKISVMPDNTLSRILSNPWIKLLMMITLVYPFVWLFKRFHSLGGGRWEVCGGAYGLKRSEPVDERNPDSKDALRDQQAGSSRVIGLKEGQWLRQWERSIKHAVASRMQSPMPLVEPQIHDLPNTIALSLDGYTDTV